MDDADFYPDDLTTADIRKQIGAFEQERRSVRRRIFWRVPVFLAIVVVPAAFIAYEFNMVANDREQWVSTPHVFLYLVAIVAAVIAVALALRPASRLRKSYRERLMPIIFGFILGVRYMRGTAPGSFERLPREAIGDFNRESFDDVVSGSLGGFAFELYEARFDRKSQPAPAIGFRGVIVAFETEAPFPGTLIATRKGNQVVSFFQGMFGGRALDPVTSGVAALDESYEFRTDNPEAAEPLVRGRLAQALLWLAESWPEEPARIALQASNGFLMLPTSKNFFELPDISRPLDYETHVRPMIADMASLLATAGLVRKIGDADAATA